jgi:hypothetical protein
MLNHPAMLLSESSTYMVRRCALVIALVVMVVQGIISASAVTPAATTA